MTPTPEQIAAYADDQLDGEERDAVAAAVAADPALQGEVEAHRAVSDRLSAHFAPLMERELPERLIAPLRPREAEVVDFATARRRKEAKRTLPRWGWLAGPALAASLALAVVLPRGGSDDDVYADGALARALDSQLVATQVADTETRILLSFASDDGTYCRAFTAPRRSGIACRDDRGWKFEMLGDGTRSGETEFRQAGNSVGDILAAAQDMAADGALDAEAEAAAAERNWQD
jgi:hypothetical protein